MTWGRGVLCVQDYEVANQKNIAKTGREDPVHTSTTTTTTTMTTTAIITSRSTTCVWHQHLPFAPAIPSPNLNHEPHTPLAPPMPHILRHDLRLVYHAPTQVTYNNRANAKAGMGRWQEALDDYRRASAMQPDYVFPKASAALVIYQLVSITSSSISGIVITSSSISSTTRQYTLVV